MAVHPLRFHPIFKPKVWGGRELDRLLDKRLPPEQAIGESWECADLPGGRSVVAEGPAAGRTLSQLVEEWGGDLTGRAALFEGRFPLLIKFLDAREPLSIQVHPGAGGVQPNTAMLTGKAIPLSEPPASAGGLPPRTERLGSASVPPAPPKHEAWYVLAADPGAVIYRGVKPGVTLDQLRAAAGTRAIVDLLQAVPAKPGQCLYCPGGVVHALGGGVVVAEIQTPSDTTYRLYDWERQRPAADAGLHVDAALAAIDLAPPPATATRRSHVGGLFTTVTRLVDTAAFRVELVRFVEGMTQDIPYAEPVIWIVLEGAGAVLHRDGPPLAFRRGDVIVLPAALRDGRLRTDEPCAWLEVTIPIASDLAGFPHPSRAALRDDPPAGGGVVPLSIRRD